MVDVSPVDILTIRRRNLIVYAQDKLDACDWHALSDAANDLRELDAEIRAASRPKDSTRVEPHRGGNDGQATTKTYPSGANHRG